MRRPESRWSLRVAAQDDDEFIYALKRMAYAEHVASTYGEWDDAWQRTRFDDRFDPAATSIIVVDGRAVGEVAVDWDEDPVFLLGIELLPEVRGKGIGSEVLLWVLERAREREKAVRLQVFVVNSDARRLYERLGFRATGTSETHVQMLRVLVV